MSCWQPLLRRWRELCFIEPDTVLLESTLPSSEQHQSYLFRKPVRLLVAQASGLDAFWADLESALAAGLHLAGFLTYEAGALLQGLPVHPLPPGMPLAVLGAYRSPEIFDHLAPASMVGESGRDSELLQTAMMPKISVTEYTNRIEQIQRWIAAGETYQVNLTMQLRSRYHADPLALYERLCGEQPCSYNAVLRLSGSPTILSFSPELFFSRTAAGEMVTRPMKGTASRGASPEADREQAGALRRDEKNRAEHVMIVDLLRNDLGRICEMGSVQVENLFHVETYPTVHQMVSTVRGQGKAGQGWREIFKALFPSGSITGAPKHHTMELISQLEPAARGVYTGAIGHISPDGSAALSVAIRTLVLDTAMQTATMGVGGGIVADSHATAEYRECLLKAQFVRNSSLPLELIETVLAVDGQIGLLERHLARLAGSAESLGFVYDATTVQDALQRAMPPKGRWRLRLTMNTEGKIRVIATPLEAWPPSLRVRLASEHTRADDLLLRYKTNFRQMYDEAFRQARAEGLDEAVFTNTEGELTEGCVTNLLVRQAGRLLTPPLSSGVLPGLRRAMLVESGEAEETVLRVKDLLQADAVYLCNSVRGVTPVRQLILPAGEAIEFAVA